MNLTADDLFIEDNEFSPSSATCACERCAANHMVMLQARGAQVASGAKPQQLAGFFDSLKKTVKLSTVGPLKATKALVTGGPGKAMDQWKKDFQQGRVYAAERSKISVPVLSALSPFTFGITGAVAAGIKRSTDELHKKKAATLQSKGDNEGIMTEYSGMAGSVPGRAFGVDLMKKVLVAALTSRQMPPGVGSKGDRIYWRGMENDFIDAKEGKCTTSGKPCPPGLRTLAKEVATSGATAEQVLSRWFDGNRLITGDHQSGLPRQIFLDIADAALAEANPDAPYSYGVSDADFETAAPPASSSGGDKPLIRPAAPVSAPSSGLPIAPRVVTPRGPTLQQIAPPDASRQIETLLASMQSQGANNAQMMAAALQSLASRGVDTASLPVQQAVQQEVATAGQSKVNPWILGGLAAIGVAFALARPSRKRH